MAKLDAKVVTEPKKKIVQDFTEKEIISIVNAGIGSGEVAIPGGGYDPSTVLDKIEIISGQYGNKTYKFAMNGQTGKFVGNLPADKGKMWGIAVAVFAAVTIIATAVQYFMMGA